MFNTAESRLTPFISSSRDTRAVDRLGRRRVVISSGVRDLVAAAAWLFVERGCGVTIDYVLSEEGQALPRELGCEFLKLDIVDRSAWGQTPDVNAVINNAGILTFGSTENCPATQLRQVFDLNVRRFERRSCF